MSLHLPPIKPFSWISSSFMFVLLWLSSFHATAQVVRWQKMGSNRNATFYDVQKDFYRNWKGKIREMEREKRRAEARGKAVVEREDEAYEQFKRWESYMAPRVYPSGNMALPSNSYKNFIQWQHGGAAQRSALRQTNTISSSGNWTELGPLSKASGYDAGVGRVDFIKFNPTNSNIAYLSTPDGGLWKTTNVSAALPSWTTNADFLPVIGTSELAIAPDGNTMYLATGSWEGDKRSAGILKSTDGGTTWNTTSLTFTATDNYFIRRLQMDPTNPLIMMAATDGGIFRTTDGWATNSSTNLDGGYSIHDIKFKPTDHNTVYASGKTGLNTSVFYKSIDNGVTWAPVTSGLPSSSDVSRIILAVTPANPNYVYALAGNNAGGYKGLYRSTNSGASFTTQSTTPNVLDGSTAGDGSDGQAGHDLAIAISPSDANLITVGGISQWRSTDGGVTWNLLTFWFGTDPLNPGGSPVAPYIHADVQTIMYQPGSSTTLFTSSDGGIYRSTDNGVSWVDISNNLRISQETDVANSATNAGIIVAGLQDIGNIKTTNSVFTYLGGGDGESAFIDRTNDLNIVTSDPNGNHRVSTDGGASFNSLNGNGLPSGTEFFSPIIQDPVTSTTCYAGGRPNLYKSTNYLSAPSHTWTSIGTPLGTGSIYRFVVYPGNAQIIYTIKQDAVSKTINGGTTWTNVTGNLTAAMGNALINNITMSNTDPNKVWVSFSGYSAGDKVYKTIDGGATWTDVNSTGLPNIPTNTIVYRNNSATDEVYVGADIGVFAIDNTTPTWTPFFTGLARSRVTDLEIFYPTGKIRASTYGRGSWESDLNVAAVNYTITATSGANGTVTPAGATNVASGGSQVYTITPAACYQVATLTVDGATVPPAATYTFSNVTASHTIAATFSLLTYAITASTGTNGTVTPAGVTTVNCGGSQIYTITPAAGFATQTILVDGASVAIAPTYTFSNVTATHTISATFATTAKTITASAGANGTISPSGAVNVANGASQTFTITPNSCYQIATLVVDGATVANSGTYTFTNVTTNHTISATFSQLSYSITASTGTNGTVTPAGITNVNCGGSQIYTITPAAGFSTQNITVDGASVAITPTYTFSNVTANHTITATFAATARIITATAGSNGTISPSGAVNVANGGSQTFTITPAACFKVSDVLVDGVSVGGVGTYTFTNVTANHSIAASFTAMTYAITASTGANGTVTPAGVTNVNCGGNQVYTITPSAGFATQSITVDGASVAIAPTYTFSNVTATHTISATFSATAKTITATAGANGSISPSGAVNVANGGNQTFTITPASCFKVADVLVDGASVGAVGTYTFTNVTASHTISASFSALTYAITASTGTNGTVTPAGVTTVNCGGNQVYTITPSAGFVTQSITVDGALVAVAPTYTFSNVAATHTISATFTASVTTTSYRINAGGPQVTNSIGVFAADNYYTAASTFTNSTSATIAGTTNGAIYQTERYSTSGVMNYAFPVANGSYKVILHFAEIYLTGQNQRVFDVSIEGNKVLDNYDILKKVAPNTATTETFNTNVTDGTLNIYFSSLAADGGSNSPKVSAIEVLQTSANLSPTANAGPDQTITLPTSSTSLSGSGSDPDGTIAGYTWTQLSGPNLAVFNSKTIAAPTVSGLAAGSYWFTLAVTDNMGATSPVDTVLVTVNASGNTPVYRINAGGPQVTNSIGVFAADAYYTAASTFSNSTSATIAGTTNGAIYQTERYSTSGVLNYAFPVTNGQYTVILHFAEIYLTGQNQRVFDVSIEGNKVLDNYDILKKVAPNTATTETFTTNVSDGTLNILLSSLTADGGSNSPKVSAIEIIRTSANLAPTANAGNDTTITLPPSSLILKGSGTDADGTIAGYTWSQVSGPNTASFSSTSVATPTVSGLVAGTYWFSLVVTDNMGAASPADMVNVNVNAAGNTPVYRINAGGPQVTNSIGVFAADAYYTASSTFSNSTSTTIAGTSDGAIYQTERYSTSGLLNYAFPVTNGSYKVILHFAEIYLTGMGQRVFNVSIEGTKVLDRYDILKKVAPNTATTETFTTSVTDGTLNILFSTLDAGGSNSPKVSAIEIIKLGSGTNTTTPGALADIAISQVAGKSLNPNNLKVMIAPNPSNTYFTLHITSSNNKTMFLRIFAADGKLIESRANISANGSFQVGNRYTPGFYYAEVMQGTEKVTLKFIKLKN